MTAHRLLALACCAALAACSPGNTPTPDAGDPVDAGPKLPPVEPVVPSPCDEDRVLPEDFNGNTVTFTVDTGDEALEDLRPVDIGMSCGNPDSDEWAPQQVVQVTVPGTGKKSLAVDTRRAATDDGFLTVVQVRRTCDTLPTTSIPPHCIGPTNTELQARGVFPVEGGETLFLVFTGYPGFDGQQLEDGTTVTSRGRMSVKLDVADAKVPVLTSAEANFVGKAFELRLAGTDDDEDAIGGVAELLAADGSIIDINGDGRGDDQDVIADSFDGLTAPLDTFDHTITIAGAREDFERLGVTKVRVRALDETYWTSEPRELSIGQLTAVGVNGTCNATARCSPGLTCDAGTCLAPAAATNSCAAGTDVALAPPDDLTAASIVVPSQVLTSGNGGLEATCAPTAGKELVYNIAVPATGKWDLVATTAVGRVPVATDTVLSIRSSCADSSTELACNDEIAVQQDSRSLVTAEVTGLGAAYVVADYYQGIASGTKTFSIQFTLRPVLTSGATCDADQRLNRCDRGYCNVDTLKCP